MPSGAQDIETLTCDADINKDGVIFGGATSLAVEFNLEQKVVDKKWTSTFLLVSTIPAEATSFRLMITAAISGQTTSPASEVFRFKQASLLPCDDLDQDGAMGTVGNHSRHGSPAGGQSLPHQWNTRPYD